MVRRFLMLGLVFVTCGLSCPSPSNSSSEQQDSSNPQSAPEAQTKPPGQPSDASKKKPRKVWTNEEVEGAKSGASTNQHGASSAGSGSASPSAAKSAAYDDLVKSYLKKLARFETTWRRSTAKCSRQRT
jgi:hypothetical protein